MRTLHKNMGILYINKNCEIYLGGEQNVYREDMSSLPLECILTKEEYEELPEVEKQNYEVLVAKRQGSGARDQGPEE